MKFASVDVHRSCQRRRQQKPYYSALPAPNDSNAGNSNPETKTVRELLSTKTNSTNEKIKIKSYQEIRDKGIAVDCENEEEIQKLIDKIQKTDELKEKLLHKEQKKRLPRCIIYNISKDTAEQKFINAIELATDCDRNSIEFPLKLKGQKEGYQHWVVELKTTAFFTLEAAGKLVVNWSIYKIKEFFSVRRCFSCQSFGHLQRNCKSKRKLCAYCSENHDTRDCADMNALCARWGYRTNNNRGYQVENFITEKDLQLLNSPGAEQTFQRYNAEGWPDITLALTPTLANMCD
ncbi:hypothetical protein AVEN_162168-1 [Araneus ventricosus]|uniref:CCHC-type domain-containing protein n=1 Tax=Araneus ventricosus TaxID=182803 RepID=A0A4Y2GXU8_ARAVE|nr:hypothetical protein AVEN_162168-1 [Araneus ventricosus]